MRRPVLKQFGIHSLPDLYARLGGLWKYITEWASLRLPDDANSARRTLHPLWAVVQSAAEALGDPAALTRQTASASTAPVEWYVQHIAGCLVGLAARLNLPALPDALGAFQHCAGVHMPPAAFTARVQAECIRLGMGGMASQPDHPPPV